MLTVRDLYELLQNHSPDDVIVIAKDGEFNDISPLSSVESGMQYEDHNTWSGEVYDGRVPAEDGAKGVACLVLVPTN